MSVRLTTGWQSSFSELLCFVTSACFLVSCLGKHSTSTSPVPSSRFSSGSTSLAGRFEALLAGLLTLASASLSTATFTTVDRTFGERLLHPALDLALAGDFLFWLAGDFAFFGDARCVRRSSILATFSSRSDIGGT
jgi:hypothetical protein